MGKIRWCIQPKQVLAKRVYRTWTILLDREVKIVTSKLNKSQANGLKYVWWEKRMRDNRTEARC